jgi:hypothetical protein
VLLQCPFCEEPGDRIGHGVFRSWKYTNGLPYRVELNANGTMKTTKKNAKKGLLHFNCPCIYHFRHDPPISAALQECLEEYGYDEFHGKTQTSTAMQHSSTAATAVGVAASIKRNGRSRKKTPKAQENEEAAKAVEQKKEQQEQAVATEDRTKRRCWRYGADAAEPCTRRLYFNEVLCGLCGYHARAAVAELLTFIKEKYDAYEEGDNPLLDLIIVDVEAYLLRGSASVVEARKMYVKLSHEFRFHHYRCSQ